MLGQNQPGLRKVALICEGTESGFSGFQNYVLLLARHLDPSRYQSVVIGMDYNYRQLQTEFLERVEAFGIPVEVLPSTRLKKPWRAVADLKNLGQIFRTHKVDIAHIHTCKPLGARKIVLAARLKQVRGVLRTEHMPPSVTLQNEAAEGYGRRSIGFFDWLTDRIVTVSEADKAEQVRLIGRNPAKLYRSYSGIELAQFDPDHDVGLAKARLGLNSALPVVGAVGRLHPQKGFSHFVEAAALVVRQYGAVNFLLVGSGELENELRQQVEEAGLRESFHFVGFQEDIRPFVEAMDITVMPSLYEGLPLTLLEFMALGKPSVVTDLPCFSEALGDGPARLAVPGGDSRSLAQAITGLLNDPTCRRQMRQAVLERIQREFSVQRLSSDMMNLYDSILEKRQPVPVNYSPGLVDFRPTQLTIED